MESRPQHDYCSQHVWTLLDADTDFQTIVLSLEEDKKLESLMSKSACTKWKAMTSPLVLMQWQAMVVTGHGYSNVLNRTLKPRSDCFVQSSNDDQASGVTKKTKASQEPPPPPTYVGGMFSPMPMRKIVISVWIYPPDVVLPPIGEPIPENDEAVTDFFLSNE